MRKTKALYGNDARTALIKGVKLVHDAVAPTMGAKGRNAIYRKYGMPIVTNDGVSIAREILPKDEYEAIGAEAVKQAAEQTNFAAGDGTSSTIVLATTLIDLGEQVIEGGYNPMVLRREMEVGVEKLIAALAERSVPTENLEQVARISVENDEIAKIVSEVVEQVGPDGAIEVIEAPGANVRVDVSQGYIWKQGYVTPYMMTNGKGEAVLDNCAVVITDRSMNLNKDFIKVLQGVKDAGYSSVLVVAENVEGELLQTLIENKTKNVITTVVVKRPETQQELEDLAAMTGAIAVTSEKDIKEITIDHTGIAERVVVTHEKTIIVGDPKYSDKVVERIDSVKAAIEAEDQEKYGAIEVLKLRLARLVGGVARIKVGAATEAEQAYLKMKVDDAVGACRAALEEGIVPGGGTTLRDLVDVLSEDSIGEGILAAALPQPFTQILENAGIEMQDGDKKTNFDVMTGETVTDMMEVGIVDPAKVIRCVIENAVSTAKTLLTTECVIADIPDEPIQAVLNQQPKQG